VVYFFDKTMCQIFSQRDMSESEICFFVDMASAHRLGQCYLCGDIESLKFFTKNLNYPTKNIYGTILAHHAESRSVMEKVNTVFILTMDIDNCFNTLPAILRKKGKSQIIYLEHAMKWKLSFECCLLAENLEDCEFLTLISRQKYNSLLKGIDIKFHCENGGGTTTADVFRKCVVQDKIPTLCVTDSDQKFEATREYPQVPPKGETFNKVCKFMKTIENLDNPPNCFFPLEVHEVENLIPLCILIEMQGKYHNMADGVRTLLSLRNINNGNPILFYDFKKGFPFIDKEPKRVYWQEILNLLGVTDFIIPPSKEKLAELSSNVDVPPIPFPGLHCNALLRSANSWLKNNLKKDLVLDKYLQVHWDNIADTIFTWGCVSVPMYS